jgi:hypothetical protein
MLSVVLVVYSLVVGLAPEELGCRKINKNLNETALTLSIIPES